MSPEYVQEEYATYPEDEAIWDVLELFSRIETGTLPIVWNAEEI
jgi:hypothetical protein